MKSRQLKNLALALTASLTCGAAQTQAPALSAEQLARCAGQVQSLRDESARIHTLNAQHDRTRDAINARSAALKAERNTIDPDDLDAGLNLRERLAQHTANTLAFNAEIAKIRGEINAVSALKDEYDRNCAQRPYRRTDFDSLPEAARNAMRAGLSGVQVPFLDPASPPIPQ
ncbi:MAG: hypothetical protein ACT4PZ_12130 [Panacagrimonas sp.]